MQKATQLGPTGNSKCPECGNSLDNAHPNGTPANVLRCSTCKVIFEAYLPKYRFVEELVGNGSELTWRKIKGTEFEPYRIVNISQPDPKALAFRIDGDDSKIFDNLTAAQDAFQNLYFSDF